MRYLRTAIFHGAVWYTFMCDHSHVRRDREPRYSVAPMTYGLCCCIQLGCIFRRVSYAAGTPADRLLHAPYDGATRRRIDAIALQHRADRVQPRGAARTLIMCFVHVSLNKLLAPAQA